MLFLITSFFCCSRPEKLFYLLSFCLLCWINCFSFWVASSKVLISRRTGKTLFLLIKLKPNFWSVCGGLCPVIANCETYLLSELEENEEKEETEGEEGKEGKEAAEEEGIKSINVSAPPVDVPCNFDVILESHSFWCMLWLCSLYRSIRQSLLAVTDRLERFWSFSFSTNY